MLIPAIRAIRLPLTLLVTRVLTDHENGAVTANDLALLAHGLDRGSDLHRSANLLVIRRERRLGPRSRSRARQPQKISNGRLGGPALFDQVPRRQNARSVTRNGDGVLEMGGKRAVLRIDGPLVVRDPDLGGADVDHRLDC